MHCDVCVCANFVQLNRYVRLLWANHCMHSKRKILYIKIVEYIQTIRSISFDFLFRFQYGTTTTTTEKTINRRIKRERERWGKRRTVWRKFTFIWRRIQFDMWLHNATVGTFVYFYIEMCSNVYSVVSWFWVGRCVWLDLHKRLILNEFRHTRETEQGGARGHNVRWWRQRTSFRFR